MAITLNKVEKTGKMNLWEIIKFQVHLHVHLNEISISESDIECLTLLAMNGKPELTSFCNAACLFDERNKDHDLDYEREIFKSPQSVRNSINKLKNIGLIKKNGKSKKTIQVDSSLGIQASGNILIQVKFLRLDESKEA